MEKHAGRVPKIKGGAPPGKCETSRDDAGGNALQWGLGSACPRQSQRKGFRHFCRWIEDRNGCTQSTQRFLHQLEGRARHVPVCSTSRRTTVKRENEANCFQSEQNSTQTNKDGGQQSWRRVVLQRGAGTALVRRCSGYDDQLASVAPEELRVVAQVTSMS